jgi:hypothetical protein
MSVLALIAAAALAAPAAAADVSSLQPGDAAVGSAGPLAFGPDGILFVGDTANATIWALDTGDREPGSALVAIEDVGQKIAALLGVLAADVAINDMAVNPISGRAYLSVSRGQGPDATPVVVRTGSAGALEALSLKDIPHSSVSLGNAPSEEATDRRGRSLRREAITDLHYLDGKLFVAGLSNEEFASKLRSVAFPFTEADGGTSVEIYHASHGAWETRSPVRTFVPYEIRKQAHLLAAYTCTPLVSFPVDELEPGTKVVGKTIAELGNRNRPLDMVVYRKDGGDYLLMSNSSRGVMRMSTAGIQDLGAITEQVEETAGLAYETLAEFQGVEQLDRLGDQHALLLVRAEDGTADLTTIPLP